jgi:hypothetical protein
VLGLITGVHHRAQFEAYNLMEVEHLPQRLDCDTVATRLGILYPEEYSAHRDSGGLHAPPKEPKTCLADSFPHECQGCFIEL